MKLEDITIILGADAAHLEELKLVWPGWMRFKPELRAMPCVVFYDAAQVAPEDMAFMSDHPQVRFVAWDLPHARNQREKMLTGFVHVPAREVQTPWYLKLDTDVSATGPGEWIKPEWFEPNEAGEVPVLIAPGWKYSKPRYVMDVLDDWADGQSAFAGTKRLNLPYSSQSSIVKHPRIISWLFFGRTDWTREVAALCGADGRMPVPSQDTFMSYCAVRMGCHHVRAKMSPYGWKHQRPQRRRIKAERRGTILPGGGNWRGVIYYNCGTSCAVRLLVSLASLRKHYAGPVTLLSEGADSHQLCEKIGKALGARVVRWKSGVKPGKNMPFLAKTRLHLGTPYQTTVALDSDTLVVGPIDQLFVMAERGVFCVAQLGSWRTEGRIIQSRLRKWSNILPEDLEAAIRFGPAINTGVMAFCKDASIFTEWYGVAEQGRDHFIPDEVSCQMMLHRHKHRILDGRWNRSCRHDDPDRPETRIIHYHGRKHCRPGLPYHADKWVAAYHEVVRDNLAGVREWTPAGDRQLRRHLKSSEQPLPSEAHAIHTQPQERVYETRLWCTRGHLNHDQADKYAEICEGLQPRHVLETGFCTGRSAACVLHHSGKVEKMISIDINLDYKAPHGRQMASVLAKTFPQWRVIENSSREVLCLEFFRQEFPEGIDLATIDGDHSYDGCMHDLEAVAPHLAPHGVIMVDDYRSGPPKGTRIESVTRSVDDFLAKNQGVFEGEQWHKLGKGFCIIRRVS